MPNGDWGDVKRKVRLGALGEKSSLMKQEIRLLKTGSHKGTKNTKHNFA
jgi:hypothetical protein